ncbi:MAG: hypothetical protein J6K61_02865 [Clostridia bacterium]|nr:hypothetical protein [Clostridia bacterium]
MKRIISSVLALLMLVGCLSSLVTVNVSAEIIGGIPETGDYLEAITASYNQEYASWEEKIAGDKNMLLVARQYGYELYCNRFTGEVAYKNIVTGEVLTTNPYNFKDITKSTMDNNSNTVVKLLSQIEIKYKDVAKGGTEKVIYSFAEAANNNQITVKNIKNGIRVEYVMGRLDDTYLLPGVLTEDDYLTHIKEPFEALLEQYANDPTIGMDSKAYEKLSNAYNKFETWFGRWDYATTKPEDISAIKEKYKNFGRTDIEDEDHSVYYVLDDGSFGSGSTGCTNAEKAYMEKMVHEYLVDFDQDVLDEINRKTGYVQVNDPTPVFRVALEYVLEKDGLSVSLPATSIRFDETLATLNNISVLQYFGSGNLNNDGYVFFPDGSGALLEYEAGKKVDLTASVYGEDYAYYSIDNDAKHTETIRMPIYGAQQLVSLGGGVKKNTGYLAIMEEGDSLADLTCNFPNNFDYSSVYATFYPRPYDSYNMKDAISVAENKEWTVVSDRKYEGAYRLKFVMLFDESYKAAIEASNAVTTYEVPYYEASYIGMAKAYRDYLINGGYIEALQEEDVKENNIPLYIETFGSIKTVEKVMSFPVTVDTPLTSFDDVQKMYDQLSLKGVSNINFKLTGYANGGIYSKYPKKLKWVKALGGSAGFERLITYANEHQFGVYPDFDFAYIGGGGINLKRNAARAVDDRYCSKQVYDPVYQEFTSYFDICISPSSIFSFAEKFSAKFSKYNPIGISVATLAKDLNSDFNEDNPQNREDAKASIQNALGTLQKDYGSVMSEGGNVYTLRYIDHLLGAPIDSSKYTHTTKTVPFWGIVLHGYEQYAGSVINEAGDGDYQLLKSIENGAYLYYLLSYRNTNLMKEDTFLSQYYSLRFDIWFSDVVSKYTLLNNAIGKLQLFTIENHQFLIGERVADEDELNEELEKSVNLKLSYFLENKYAALKDQGLRELNVKQLTVNAIRAGLNSIAAIEEDVAFRTNSTLTEADKANIAAVWQIHSNGQPLQDYYDVTVGVVIDEEAILASLEQAIGRAPTAKQISIVKEFVKQNSYTGETAGAFILTLDAVEGITFVPSETDSLSTDGKNYVKTIYTVDSNNLVMVTYQKGTETVHFVINYNIFDVEVRLDGINGGEAFVVPAYNFSQINGTTLVD